MKNPPNLPRRRRLAAALTACLLAAVLSACGTDSKGLEADTAQQFQAKVLTITGASADGDHSGALASLDALRAELEAAASNGQVSFARHQSIKSAIDAVHTDLTAARAAAEAATPSPEPAPFVESPTPGPGKSGQSGKGSETDGNGRGKGDD